MFWCRVGLCRSNRRPRQHCRCTRAVPHSPLPSSCHCIVHQCQVAVAPSTTVKLPLRRPLSSITVALAVHHRHAHAVPPHPSPSSHHRTVPCHPLSSSQSPLSGRCAIHRRPSPSIAVHRPLLSMSRPSRPITINLSNFVHQPPSQSPPPSSPSPLSRHRAVNCRPSLSTIHRRWVAVASSIAVFTIEPSIAVELPSRRPPSIAIQCPSPTCCNLLPELLKNTSPITVLTINWLTQKFWLKLYSKPFDETRLKWNMTSCLNKLICKKRIYQQTIYFYKLTK